MHSLTEVIVRTQIQDRLRTAEQARRISRFTEAQRLGRKAAAAAAKAERASAKAFRAAATATAA